MDSTRPTQPAKKPAAKVHMPKAIPSQVSVVKPAPQVEEPAAGISSAGPSKTLQKSAPKSAPAAATPATSAAR